VFLPSLTGVLAKPGLKPKRGPKRKPTAAAVEAQMFKRKFGMPLQFVEEREWRIVHHPANKGFIKGPGVPDYYLPDLPGEELFTLVLPDNKVVSRVLQTDWFTERLFTPWKHYPALKKLFRDRTSNTNHAQPLFQRSLGGRFFFGDPIAFLGLAVTL